MITIDFETYYSKTFSLSKMTMESYIRSSEFEVIGVSVKENDGPIRWITGDNDTICSALKDLHLENDVCVAHNAAFDMAILNWVYGIRPKVIVDTLSMSRPVTGIGVGGSLRALSEYFGIGEKGTEIYNTLGKHRKDFTVEELRRFGEYCRQDVNLTYQLYKKLLPYTTPRELYLIDLTIRMFTEPTLELNADLLEKHLNKVKAEKEALLDTVSHGDRSVFMSNDKFAELLRAEGVEPPTKVSEKTGKTAYAFAKTDAGFQALLSDPNPKVQALANARLGLKSTLEETRTEAFLGIARRGPFPVLLRYYGAVNTGRFSGGDGTNPQNLPRGGALRDAIIPPEGYSIVACDSAQIEARTLSWFAGQKDLVEGFRNNEDIYSMFASRIYGRTITKHNDPEERHVGKTCILGLGYGVGAAKLQGALANGAIKVNLPIEECQRIVNIYRTGFPAITSLWKSCQRAIETMARGLSGTVGVGTKLSVNGDKTISLPNGMKLQYPDLKLTLGDDGRPEFTYKKKRFRARIYGGAATENIIQALARIIVSYQMCAIKQFLDKLSKRKADGRIRHIAHMVHDEVIVVVPDDEAELVKTAMERIMSTAPSWAPGLPVSCEAGVGKTYGEAK
jgi:DNA polymerase I-like protein with 3'-5' exonuclease and polymerase domains